MPDQDVDHGMDLNLMQPGTPRASENCDSIALKTILNGSIQSFFDEIWQQSCAIYSRENELDIESIPNIHSPFDRKVVEESPYLQLLRNGWSSVINLLENGRARYNLVEGKCEPDDCPLLFQNHECVSPIKYNHSLFHAYLDGCSVVLNHADQLCPYLASLCLDLQQTFPHAYANTYLTPPQSQAVPPHADDRDVFIIQVYGEKRWIVYRNIPIPYPYPHEQVGKDGKPVPSDVLEGERLIDRVLRPGDVLYMPRGYVHQAQTSSSTPSYHVTVALATHDWTLAGLIPNATQQCLSRVINYRKALPVTLGRRDASKEQEEALQSELDSIWLQLQKTITAKSLINNLGNRYETHNRAASTLREAIMEAKMITMDTTNVVGKEAAFAVQLSTTIRPATPAEKASIIITSQEEKQGGLNVRECAADAILSILSCIKQQGKKCLVKDLRNLRDQQHDASFLCDLTMLSFAKTCVELGGLAIVRG